MLKRFLFLLVMLLFLNLTPAPSGYAQLSGESYSGLDIVFALDVSTSMFFSSNKGNHFDRDRGMRYVFDQLGSFEAQATDPQNLRFNTVRFFFDWLQSFIDTQQQQERNLNINVSLVTFDQQVSSPPLVDWVNLNTYDPNNTERPNALAFSNPEPTLQEGNSDFINLYEAVGAQMDNRPANNSNLPRKAMMIVITDSLPCSPPDEITFMSTGADGSRVREAACASRPYMQYHLASANLDPLGKLREVDKLFFMIPPSDGSLDITQQVQSLYANNLNWSAAADEMTFASTIDQMPGLVFKALLRSIAEVLGLREAEDTRTFANLGLSTVQGTFEVPPYQAGMEVILFATSAEGGISRPTFVTEGVETSGTVLSTEGNGLLNRLLFNAPRPGTWNIQTEAESLETWVSFIPARALLTFVNSTGTQYEPLEFHYQVVDQQNNPLPLREDYMPILNLNVTGPGGNQNYNELELESNSLKGRYYPVEAGTYRVSGTVTAPPEWNTGNIDFGFLSPATAATVTVDPVIWKPQFGTEEQAASITNGILEISRRYPVAVSLQAQKNGAAIALPPTATAKLILEPLPNFNDACPEQSEIALQKTRDDLFIAPDLRFPEAGDCKVSLEISVSSSLPPLNGNSAVVYRNENLGRVRATQTIRLNVALLDPAGESVMPGGSEASVVFEMMDRQSTPQLKQNTVTWETDSLTVNIVFTDEAGNPIDPQFIGVNVPEEDATTQELAALKTPFEVRLTRGDEENIAEEKGIVVRKSPQVGYYTLTVHDLAPGKYILQVNFDPENPDLTSEYEYEERLLVGRVPGQPVTFSATLNVEKNSSPQIQTAAALGIALLVVGLVGMKITGFFNNRRAPLSGQLAIYRRSNRHKDKGRGVDEKIWEGDLPSHRNKHQFERKQLPLWEPQITFLEASTKRNGEVSRQKGAYVTLTVEGKRIEDMEVVSGEFPEHPFHSDTDFAYFLVKDYDETVR